MSDEQNPPIRLRELLYPSNLLTVARLLMLPAALRAISQPEARWRALATLGLAMLTDVVDGPIARHRNEVSSLGQILDPVADKLMIDATAVTLSRSRGFPWWATGALLLRDACIVVGSVAVLRRRATISLAHPTGKATTAGLTAAMLLYIADGPRSGRPALYAALIPFVGSLIVYIGRFWRLMTGRT